MVLVVAGLSWRLCQYKPVANYLNAYGVSLIEGDFGKARLEPDQEAMILAIAQEMGITKKIEIRKMNSTALSIFGYHNAFVIFPTICAAVIPVGNVPVFYASAGFFEDITPMEQRFLIGHELIHAREGHCRLEGLIKFVSWVLSIILCGLLGLYLKRRYPVRSSFLILPIMLWFGAFWLVHLSGLYYRRQIEYVADAQSLKLLNSYDGLFAISKRWQKEFCIPRHNSNFFGLLADHPSCHEREQICLELQAKYLEKN